MFLWTDLVELVRQPFSALSQIDARRRLADGLLALGLSVTLPAAVAELAALGPFRPPANLGSLPSLTAQGADIYARWVYMHRFLIPVYGIGVSLVLWLAAAGLIHGIARALGGRGNFAGLMKLVGYAALVGLVNLPVALADALLKFQGNARAELAVGQLAGLLGVAIFLWQNALLVVATRQHYGISTERAIAAVIGPIGAVLVLLLALIILAITLAIIAQQPA
ncbi:MAG: YIP1 family protein [Chloroflexi bacterium]|nr:MAG: YIP1 family protein [Chloroflexota bacterium]